MEVKGREESHKISVWGGYVEVSRQERVAQNHAQHLSCCIQLLTQVATHRNRSRCLPNRCACNCWQRLLKYSLSHNYIKIFMQRYITSKRMYIPRSIARYFSLVHMLTACDLLVVKAKLACVGGYIPLVDRLDICCVLKSNERTVHISDGQQME